MDTIPTLSKLLEEASSEQTKLRRTILREIELTRRNPNYESKILLLDILYRAKGLQIQKTRLLKTKFEHLKYRNPN